MTFAPSKQLGNVKPGDELKQNPPKSELTNVVNVWAVKTVETETWEFTKNQHPHGQKLEKPIEHTQFLWKGKLHGSRPDIISSSGFGATPEACAQHFAPTYRDHLNPKAVAVKEASYRFSFTPPKDAVQGSRDLTPKEKEAFVSAFQISNQEAAIKAREKVGGKIK